MYEQMNLFDFMEDEKPKPPILLEAGQTVYLVNKGDIIWAEVLNENWTCGEDFSERGYRLQIVGGGRNVVYNNYIGNKAFNNLGEAEQKASEYLNAHHVILASDIKPLSTIAYSYIRDYDQREMTAFLCDIGNDMYYIKEFKTYHHITEGKKTVKEFMNQQEFEYQNLQKIEGFEPTFKNMYAVSPPYDGWIYAEYRFEKATG